MSKQISISEFYSNKCVFITGGTGFIGKIIVEKLLRSCPEVDTIYLLARQKKNKKASERIQEITNSPLFDVVRKNNSEAFQKICLMEGDIIKENLGLSENDQKIFFNKINVIIHAAATIYFNDPLKVAITANLISVQELMKLSRKVQKLDSFVYVSTAYTNWFEKDVKEIIYKPKYDPNKVIEMCKTLSDEELEKEIPSIGKHVNTYTFSKSLAEYLIFQEGNDLPIAIVRPSVVTTSNKEPFSGWVDNWGGATHSLFMAAKGVFKYPHMRSDYIFDIIPCDITVNMILAASWKVGTDMNSRNSSPQVYNCSSSSINPIYFKELYEGFIENARKYPCSEVLSYPKIKFFRSHLPSDCAVFVYQKIPAFLCDFVLTLAGKKPKFVKIIDFVYSNYNSAKWATTNKIIFHSENPVRLMNSMSQKDLQEFDFDVRKISWSKFIENSYFGVRKFMGKEKSDNFPVLRKKIQRIKYVQYIATGSLIVGSMFLLNKTQIFRSNKES
ncbi:hypothetical protein PVAND_002346 [Polypedilum vanderplanki]|uniref:Fatty acyl-CoA reductase n=1 Tax=Polypedilum vanderplanki TaxID=319348 RepID=A0A9J6BQP6_POLVA|nr:hypothetical protein PVAND_002346 [Polypedilum vanderplanki]